MINVSTIYSSHPHHLTIQNATVPAPNIKLVNFDRESDMAAGETRTVKVAIEASQMTVR